MVIDFSGFFLFQIDPSYDAPPMETRTLFGLQLQQLRNNAPVTKDLFDNVVTDGKKVGIGALHGVAFSDSGRLLYLRTLAFCIGNGVVV